MTTIRCIPWDAGCACSDYGPCVAHQIDSAGMPSRPPEEVLLRLLPLYQKIDALRKSIAELEETADVRARMMDRARALYQAAHPGTEDRWPDGAATVAWLVERVGELEEQLAIAREKTKNQADRIRGLEGPINHASGIWARNIGPRTQSGRCLSMSPPEFPEVKP